MGGTASGAVPLIRIPEFWESVLIGRARPFDSMGFSTLNGPDFPSNNLVPLVGRNRNDEDEF
jgi:hypothetical protein